jgi:hypothetical protein
MATASTSTRLGVPGVLSLSISVNILADDQGFTACVVREQLVHVLHGLLVAFHNRHVSLHEQRPEPDRCSYSPQ